MGNTVKSKIYNEKERNGREREKTRERERETKKRGRAILIGQRSKTGKLKGQFWKIPLVCEVKDFFLNFTS